jgi:hypothetical protein
VPLWEFDTAGNKKATAAFLAALSGLHHLTSLEVGLIGTWSLYPWAVTDDNWQQLLQAAPKQLQRLVVRVAHDKGAGLRFDMVYSWEPLAAFTQLKQLQVGQVDCQQDLAPLAALPSLTSLGLQWGNRVWKPLVAVKGVLQDLDVYDVSASNQEHLQQLTNLTSLIVREAEECRSIPEQVASRLQRLDWGLVGKLSRGSSSSSRSSTSTGTDLLAHCSSCNLRKTAAAWAPLV